MKSRKIYPLVGRLPCLTILEVQKIMILLLQVKITVIRHA